MSLGEIRQRFPDKVAQRTAVVVPDDGRPVEELDLHGRWESLALVLGRASVCIVVGYNLAAWVIGAKLGHPLLSLLGAVTQIVKECFFILAAKYAVRMLADIAEKEK